MSCIVADYDETATVETREQRKSRKDRRCFECGGLIKKGDKYEYVSALFDGEWKHMSVCMDCTSIRNALFKHGIQYGALWEDLISFIREGFDLDFLAFNDCTAAARSKIIEIFDSVTE